MRFTFEGQTFTLEFQRSYREIFARDKAGTPDPLRILHTKSRYPYTTAIVWKEGEGVPYRTYTVGCSHRDNFTREEGRKNALKMICKGNSLPKAFKSALWDAYFSRT